MLKELIGNWKVIGCQLHAKWLPDSIFREFRYTFTQDDKFLLDWAELSFPDYMGGFPKSKAGKALLNTNVTPHQIDFIPDDGKFGGKTLQGIFELDHDVLKAIFSFPGAERPTVFNARQGQVYEIWQRV